MCPGKSKYYRKAFKIYYFLFVLLIPLITYAQNEKTLFFGANGKMTNIGRKEIKKEINSKSGKHIEIKTYKNSDNEWKLLMTEKIKKINDSVCVVKLKGDEYSEKIRRIIRTEEDSYYKFFDFSKGKLRREGYTSSKYPLLFEGKVSEFYDNGKLKSVSEYRNNELLANENWLENGEEYISNVFYSVDESFIFGSGINELNKYIL